MHPDHDTVAAFRKRHLSALAGRCVQALQEELARREPAQPDGKAQPDFTDRDSRVMVDGANKGSFIQACNVKASVESQAQVLVEAEITQLVNDSQQPAPMIQRVEADIGRKPEAVSADDGYWNEANVTGERVAGVELYIAMGGQKHREQVEPDFDQTRERRGYRRLSLRGVGSVRQEWQLTCFTGNLPKLLRSAWPPQSA